MTPVRVLRIAGCRACPHAVFLPACQLASAEVGAAWVCSLAGATGLPSRDGMAPAVAPPTCPLRTSPVLTVLMNRDGSKPIVGPGFVIDPDKADPDKAGGK